MINKLYKRIKIVFCFESFNYILLVVLSLCMLCALNINPVTCHCVSLLDLTDLGVVGFYEHVPYRLLCVRGRCIKESASIIKVVVVLNLLFMLLFKWFLISHLAAEPSWICILWTVDSFAIVHARLLPSLVTFEDASISTLIRLSSINLVLTIYSCTIQSFGVVYIF